MRKAVIYARVSTKEQAQNLSLPTQKRACQDYCRRHSYQVVEVFEDAGESAKTLDRPEFQRLLDYCRRNKGSVHCVVVFNLSRFSRNTADYTAARALLQRLGVTVRSVNEPISDNAAGKLMENVIAAIAQFDNDTKAERTKAGMTAAVERGRWAWRAPIGYLNGNWKTGEPSLIHDPLRAPLVLKAFELIVGRTATETDALRVVTSLGLRTQRDRVLGKQTFRALLRNPIYKGILTAPGLGVSGVQGDFQPLVHPQLFDRVQAILTRKGGASRRDLTNENFPLRRFTLCDNCGTPLTGSVSRGRNGLYPYYHCHRCKGVRIAKEVLESQFFSLLDSLRPRPEYTPLFMEIVRDVWRRRHAESERTREALSARLTDLERRETRVEDAYLYDGSIDRSTYERQRDRLRDDIAAVRAELESLVLDGLDVEAVLAFAGNFVNELPQVWLTAGAQRRQKLQRAIFPNGVRFCGGEIRTAATCLAFSQLQAFAENENGMASPTGFEPVS